MAGSESKKSLLSCQGNINPASRGPLARRGLAGLAKALNSKAADGNVGDQKEEADGKMG